jgi:GPH family glycoside/pentoside/hexuronide:cation symporter
MTSSAEDVIVPGGEAAGANHLARDKRLSRGLLAVYGAGTMVNDVTAFGLNTLLLFYLTIVCGLSGSAAGIALGVALVVDSFIDPLVGSLSDNSRSRHGRRHPYMLASAVPIVVSFVLLFSIPAGLTGGALFAYALVVILAARISLSLFYVPYVALGAELSDDYAERSTIVASRVLFSVVAAVLAAFLAYGVFMRGPGGQTHRDAYPPFALTCGLIAFAAAAVSTFGTMGARGRLHTASPNQGGAAIGRLAVEVVEVFRNRSFRILFAACLILFVALGAAGALGLHANTYFWKLPTPAILIITLSASVGVLAGVFVAAAMARSLEKRVVAVLGLALIGVCQLTPVLLQLGGLIPKGGAVITLMIAAALGGLGGSIATIGFQSMMADAADEHEHLFGARREGLYFAGITLSAKASSGIGALIAGVVLDLIGFPHGIAGHAVAAIPAHTIRDLGLAYGPGASVLTAFSVITLMTYRRGKRDHDEVREALQRRRETAAGDGAP